MRRSPAQDPERARGLRPQRGLRVGQPRLERLDDGRVRRESGLHHDLAPLVGPRVEERGHLVQRHDQAGLAREIGRGHPLDRALADVLLGVGGEGHEAGQGPRVLHLSAARC